MPWQDQLGLAELNVNLGCFLVRDGKVAMPDTKVLTSYGVFQSERVMVRGFRNLTNPIHRDAVPLLQ